MLCYCAHVVVVVTVLLCYFHVLTSESGCSSVCLECRSFYVTVMCYLGFHNDVSQNLLSCFVSSLSLPPTLPPLVCPSLPPPLVPSPLPYRLCVYHIFYQGSGRECNQNHASLSDYGGTVPLSTYFSSLPSPSMQSAASLWFKCGLRIVSHKETHVG